LRGKGAVRAGFDGRQGWRGRTELRCGGSPGVSRISGASRVSRQLGDPHRIVGLRCANPTCAGYTDGEHGASMSVAVKHDLPFILLMYALAPLRTA
jgi:hypothetical protein